MEAWNHMFIFLTFQSSLCLSLVYHLPLWLCALCMYFSPHYEIQRSGRQRQSLETLQHPAHRGSQRYALPHAIVLLLHNVICQTARRIDLLKQNPVPIIILLNVWKWNCLVLFLFQRKRDILWKTLPQHDPSQLKWELFKLKHI